MSGGWEDELDELDDLLDDGSGSGSEAAGAAADVAAMDGAGEGSEAAEDGWGDDDDLDLELTSDDSGNGPAAAVKNGGAPPPPPPPAAPAREKQVSLPPPPPPPSTAKQPPPPPPPAKSPPPAASPSPPPSLVALLSAHEQMMDREISTILNSSGSKAAGEAAAGNESDEASDAQDEWDFDDDEDIFNEGNAGLDVGAGGELEVSGARDAEPRQMSENPFLRDEPDEEDEVPVQMPTAAAAAAGNGGGEAANAIEDAGEGWSDDDFFEDDDLPTSAQPSAVPPPPPQPAPVPPPPTPQPHAPPAVTAVSPPVALRTRARKAQLQTQSKPAPPVSPVAPALNATQRRIYQMLSSYMASLDDPAFLGRLHQKLHRHQTAAPGTDGGSGNAMANSAAADLKTYYAARPGLRKYTLGVELDRMDYELVLGNGRRTDDRDVIRSYFGVGEDGERMHPEEGEEAAAAAEELLVRAANQSLLADMLVALTGSEDDVPSDGVASEDDFFDEGADDAECKERKVRTAGLILSGPTLCMTSVAETCNFSIDLQSEKVEAVCDLAISVPFHGDVNAMQSNGGERVVLDGRLLLARATVSVRFRPGGDPNDEPTVQYAVRSATPLHAPDATLLARAAVSLAHDQEDPFFHDEYATIDEGEMADARDRFLLSHHLLSDSGLIAVSDHIDKLRVAAEAGSTGFRSALRQLDGVTNVSGKLQFLKETAGQGGGAGLSGFGLALPSVEEIEAAEREALAGAHMVPPSDGEIRFPRPEGHVESVTQGQVGASRPPPPPPPVSSHGEAEASRPRPLIGGLFMSGLSRIAAAATQPERPTGGWEGGGGTGLTPPSSPPPDAHTDMSSERPVFYRRDEGVLAQPPPSGRKGNEPRDLLQIADHLYDSTRLEESRIEEDEDGHQEETQDAGWSDDEFDFGDEPSNMEGESGKEPGIDSEGVVPNERSGKSVPVPSVNQSPAPRQPDLRAGGSSVSIPPPPPPILAQRPQTTQPLRSFEEEFVLVLKEKIESETKEMEETGRMKRWTPIRDDAVLRERLLEVMVAQINS